MLTPPPSPSSPPPSPPPPPSPLSLPAPLSMQPFRRRQCSHRRLRRPHCVCARACVYGRPRVPVRGGLACGCAVVRVCGSMSVSCACERFSAWAGVRGCRCVCMCMCVVARMSGCVAVSCPVCGCPRVAAFPSCVMSPGVTAPTAYRSTHENRAVDKQICVCVSLRS
jgi:hypothetical protein